MFLANGKKNKLEQGQKEFDFSPNLESDTDCSSNKSLLDNAHASRKKVLAPFSTGSLFTSKI